MKNKKILVIGASGFIGSHLTNKLLQIKYNTSIFTRKNISKKGIAEEFIGNIENKKDVEKIVKNNFDLIYNCSGFSGSLNCIKNPTASHKINVIGNQNLLESIKKYSPKTKLILSNSRLEYGKAKYLPVDENHPTNPLDIYGMDKLNSTNYAILYSKLYKIPITVLRISNIYGKFSSKKFSNYNVINHFIYLAKKGENLTIFGNGNQIRDYLYIDDLIEALLQLINNNKTNGEIYNIGYGKSIKFNKMINLIAKKTKVKTVKKTWPKLSDKFETGNYVSNINKFTKDTNWKPKISPQDGISLCLK